MALLETDNLHISYDQVEALKGVSHAPEGRRVFTTLTVEENLNLGAFGRRRDKRYVSEVKGEVFSLFPLLDEPSLGPAPLLVEQIFDIVREINRRGTAILLVEQNAVKALDIATHGYVLETGAVTTRGASGELLADEKVREACLGGSALRRR